MPYSVSDWCRISGQGHSRSVHTTLRTGIDQQVANSGFVSYFLNQNPFFKAMRSC